MPSFCRLRCQSTTLLDWGCMYSNSNASPLALRSTPAASSFQPACVSSSRALSRLRRKASGSLSVRGATKAGPKTRGGSSARKGSSNASSPGPGRPSAANSELLNSLLARVKTFVLLSVSKS